MLVLIVAKVSGVNTTISYKNESEITKFIQKYKTFFDVEFKNYERIRYHGDCDEIYKKASDLAKIIIRNKPLLNGCFIIITKNQQVYLSTDMEI